MTLQQKIDALPPLPTLEQAFENGRAWEISRREDWYAKRLALAREWIERNGHSLDCEKGAWEISAPCTCGRDALLAALGEPNE